MALSYVGGTAAVGSSVSLPSFTSDDIAVVFAYRDGSNTAPSLPTSEWTNIASSGANSCSARVGYRVLQATDLTSGTWTNATEVQVHVLRGQHPATPIGNQAPTGANSNQISYAGFTLADTSGTSWVLGMAGHRSATNVNSQAATGMTTRSGGVTSLGAHTDESVGTFATTNYSATVNASSGWRSYAVEIRESNPKSTGTVYLSLAPGLDPGVDTGHEIRLRGRVTSAVSAVLKARLYEGTTARSEELTTSLLTTSFADYLLQVGTADAAGITSYANLELRVHGYCANGDAGVFEVAKAVLVLPPEAAGESSGAISSAFTFGAVSSGVVGSASTKQTGTARLSLGGGFIPEARTNHTITLRARNATAARGTLKAAIYEGATPRTDWLESGTLGTAFASYDIDVGTADAASISSYANLELRLYGFSSLGSADVYEVSEAVLYIPAAAGGEVTGMAVLSSITNVTAGQLDQPILVYPGTAVYPQSLATVAGTAAITAVYGPGTAYGAVSFPLAYSSMTDGHIPPDRTGAGAIPTTTSLTAAGELEALGAATVASTATVAAGGALGTASHSDGGTVSAVTSIAVAGAVSAPPAPPVYIPYFETLPELLTAVAFDDNPQEPFPTWTDIAPYVRTLSMHRGRQFELDRVETGELSATLSNLDGRFSPENTSGPYYGDLIPTKRVRVGLQWVSPTENLVADGSFESGRPIDWTSNGAWQIGDGTAPLYVTWHQTGAVHPSTGGYRVDTNNSTATGAIISGYIPVDISQPYTLSHYTAQWQQLGVVDPNGTIRLRCYDANLAYLGYMYPNQASAGVSYDGGHGITYTGSFVRWGGTYNGASGTPYTATGGFIAGTEWVRVEVYLQYTATSFSQGIGVVIDAVQLVQDTIPHAWDNNKSYVAGGFAAGDIFHGYLEGYPQEFPAQGSDSVVRQRAVDAFMTLSMTKLVPGSTTLYAAMDASSPWVPANNTGLPMPQVVPFTIQVDSEQMTVTNFGPGWYYVTRGAESTTPAAHAAGAAITTQVVSFGVDYSGTRIQKVLEHIGLSASDFSLEQGQTIIAPSENVAGQTPLEHINLIAETEGGKFFTAKDGKLTFHSRHHQFRYEIAPRATWGDAGEGSGELPYSDIKITHEQERIYNIVRITSADGTVHEARDEASITDHYERALEKNWPLYDSNEARSAAYYLLKRYSRMQVRVPELIVSPQREPDVLWPYLIGMEIGQRYRVIRRPSLTSPYISDTAIDKECIVEGIQHTLEPGRAQTRLQLSLADTTHYWRLGVTGYSELGSTTRLVY